MINNLASPQRTAEKSRSKFTQYCAQFTLGPNQKCRMGAEQSIFCQNHEWKFGGGSSRKFSQRQRETIQKRNMTHIFFVSNFHEFLKEKNGLNLILKVYSSSFLYNNSAILFHLLFVQENGNKKNIAHSELNSTHFIVHCSTTAKISH